VRAVIKAVLLDLGGTLVKYYSMDEFLPLLDEAIREVSRFLGGRGVRIPPAESIRSAVAAENYEAKDCSVRPLEGRLARIFRLQLPGSDPPADCHDPVVDPETVDGMCRAFMSPIFSISQVYSDTASVLEWLKNRGFTRLIVSNLPWGCPRPPWEEEVRRHGLALLVDGFLCCRDVGWRKPAREVFAEALRRAGTSAEETIFVGDDVRCDVEGPRKCGITPVFLNREGKHEERQEIRITTLADLPGVVCRISGLGGQHGPEGGSERLDSTRSR
jgi:putative hydrolase of the HAD superfamily